MTKALPRRRSAQLVCQFGLSRAGLYAVADWFMHGTGNQYSHFRAACVDQIATSDIEDDKGANCFLTLESLRNEVLVEGLERAAECDATRWIQLRDPYNWLASLHRGVSSGAVRWPGPVSLDKWKSYARLCSATRDWLNFNGWFGDADYRRGLAHGLGFEHDLDGEAWQRLPMEFTASSFDERRYQDHAQDMDVLKRYAQFVDEPWWRESFDDESIALAEELFGMKRPW